MFAYLPACMFGFKLQLEFILIYDLWKVTAFTPSYVIPVYSGFIWWLCLNCNSNKENKYIKQTREQLH